VRVGITGGRVGSGSGTVGRGTTIVGTGIVGNGIVGSGTSTVGNGIVGSGTATVGITVGKAETIVGTAATTVGTIPGTSGWFTPGVAVGIGCQDDPPFDGEPLDPPGDVAPPWPLAPDVGATGASLSDAGGGANGPPDPLFAPDPEPPAPPCVALSACDWLPPVPGMP
jgi:hypothetical protein